MAIRDVGDRPSYAAADGVGFDQQGYCLTGVAGSDTVTKATETDSFLGTNFRSTLDEQDEEVLTGGGHPGVQVSVEQEGVVNVLCAAGNEYNIGELVYLSATAGVADKSQDSGGDTTADDTPVGKVVRYYDHTGATGPQHVAVSITGYV